ncbi:MAG: thioredoxin family protein [Rhodocyclaceae bacterium]|jgi:thioredoxin-related protein|nr:thioredoxin family protein [Rhodocyclaceae bacterium]
MRTLFRFLLIWLFVIAATTVRASPGDAFFEKSLGDYAAELKAARQQGKQGVLLVFEAEGCPFCHRMRETVLSRPEVQAFFHRHFTAYSVDILGSVTVTDFSGSEVTEKAFARALRIRATPTFLFVGVDGREIARYTGATRDAAEFMALGRYVTEGHWQKTSFAEFYPDGRAVYRGSGKTKGNE